LAGWHSHWPFREIPWRPFFIEKNGIKMAKSITVTVRLKIDFDDTAIGKGCCVSGKTIWFRGKSLFFAAGDRIYRRQDMYFCDGCGEIINEAAQ